MMQHDTDTKQKQQLSIQQKNAVKRRVLRCVRVVEEAGKEITYREVWKVLHNYFNVEIYSDLLAEQFQEIMCFINKFEYEKIHYQLRSI